MLTLLHPFTSLAKFLILENCAGHECLGLMLAVRCHLTCIQAKMETPHTAQKHTFQKTYGSSGAFIENSTFWAVD